MKVKEIKEPKVWEGFLEKIKNKTFLQSWSWGEFQKKRNNQVWRLGVYDGENLVASALIEKVEAKRGTFLLVPHGPNCLPNYRYKSRILRVLLGHLEKIAEKENANFIRFSPIWERSKQTKKVFQKTGFRRAPIHNHPEASWVLDITAPEKELLMNMRKSTRYNIRKSLKNDKIRVYPGGDTEIGLFSQLHQETAQRHDFVPFSEDYLKNELETFAFNNEMTLYVAEYEEKIGAMAFIIFWSGIGFYHHAVLEPGMRDYPLSYRILWEGIKEAKKRGFYRFDFWGYASPESDHPWAGPTLFKMGFGGCKKEYVKTQDFVLTPLYWFDYLVETIRRKKRGFDG